MRSRALGAAMTPSTSSSFGTRRAPLLRSYSFARVLTSSPPFSARVQLARTCTGGVLGHLMINAMALPPLLSHGSAALKAAVVPAIVRGEHFISLAVSEPGAGSDVAALAATAVRVGDTYVLNGTKKWITGCLWALYFTLAARTGGAGTGGCLSFSSTLRTPGVSTRRIRTQGGGAHNTGWVFLKDVVVPASCLIGEEGKGFGYMMRNFNHERWMIAAQAVRCARACLSEAWAHARVRRTFGTTLLGHGVLRAKLADMARRVEAAQALLEAHTYRMMTASDGGGDDDGLAASAALLKVHASITFEFCAREASQIFGGAAVVREGPGRLVERLYREVRATAIPGGAEEVLRDLAVRQADRHGRRAKL
jgi:alkylation response protein AidB-like acyl-CoA dehydrogenase